MTLKKILTYSGMGLLTLSGMSALASAYVMMTSNGQNFARDMLVDYVHDNDIATLNDVRGNPFGDLRVGRIQIPDTRGVWLDIADVHVTWHPLRFIAGGQIIDRISVARMDVLRLPEKDPNASEDIQERSSESFSVPIGLIGQLLPKKLDMPVVRVAIEPQEPKELSIQASGTAARYAVNVHTLQGTPTELDAVMRLRPRDIALDLNVNEQASGLITTLIGAPSDAALDIQAKVETNARGIVTISTMDMAIGDHTASLNGTYDLKREAMDMIVQAQLVRLEDWHNITGVMLSGGMDIRAQVRGKLRNLIAKIDASGDAIGLDAYQFHNYGLTINAQGDVTKEIPQGQVSVSADGIYQDVATQLQSELAYDGAVAQVEKLILQHGEATLNGTGEMHITRENFTASLQAHKWPVQNFVPTFPLAGLLDINMDASGSFDDVNIESDAALVSERGDSRLELQAHITDRQNIDADMTAHIDQDAIVFDVKAKGCADQENIVVDRLAVDGTGLTLNGNGTYDLQSLLAEGVLTIDAQDLRPLGTVLGQDIRGRAKVDGQFTLREDLQQVTIKADAADVYFGNVSIANLKMNADGSLQERLDIDMTMRGRVSGRRMSADIKGWGKGWKDQPIEAHIAKLQGNYGRADIRLLKPTDMYMRSDLWRIDDTQLRIGRGLVSIKAQVNQDVVDGRLTVRDVRIQEVLPHTDMRGRIEGNITLKGTVEAPQADIDVTTRIRMDGHAIQANAEGTWNAKKLTARVTAQSDTASLNGSATVDGGLSLLPLAADIHDGTALSGVLKADIPLDIANSFLWSGGHRVEGSLTGNTTLAGTLGAPQVNGVFDIKDAHYEQVTSGVCVRNINGRIRGSQDRVTLDHIQARDPKGKLMDVTGSLLLSGNQALNVRVDFDQFRLFCGGLAFGDIDGDVNINGTVRDMMIKGRLALGPLDIQIPGAGGNEAIPEVKVERVRPGRDAEDAQAASVQRLDIVIDAPSRVFVRGRGLDAEFGGKIALSGFADNPLIEGRLAAKRGTFQFLDRSMKLDTAAIRFNGPMPPSPFLEIAATTQVRATQLTVNLTGPVAKPSLALKSSPARPQDEILALLLFGREIETISAFEALQLAQAARVLSGQDGGNPGLLDMARGALGLDTLSLGMDDDNNVNVSTGKYVTEKVFVGVQQGATPESRKVISEIELTPSISAKTSVDGDGNQGVGAQWRYDY